ncbi:MAG: class I SAM-dependent methyltransferase [Hyphomicrobiaceae bacterium]|nr:class I SAM-dependent methyltransferase [Hyphomicrobiaceae bacterium]
MRTMTQSGRDHYNELYIAELEQEAEWLRKGCGHKVDSIEILCRRAGLHPNLLLELGSGTGAVIEECQKRGIANDYVAVDYSQTATDYLGGRCPGIRVIQGDITDATFKIADKVDLVVLSHVVEHLEQPRAFLASMQNAIDFDYVLIEVPLEDLPLTRLKNQFRDRTANKAGHVQFFTAETFESLVKDSGLEIVDRRRYIPVPDAETIDFVVKKDAMPSWRRQQMLVTRRIIPQLASSLWSNYYYAHHAVLCRKALKS